MSRRTRPRASPAPSVRPNRWRPRPERQVRVTIAPLDPSTRDKLADLVALILFGPVR